MRLTDLEPKWLILDGARIGFVFRNPVRGVRGWWTSCFFKPTPEAVQEAAIERVLGTDAMYQECNPDAGWRVVDGTPALAIFETMSIQPSLDGGPGFWHGFITNGEIVGGLPEAR